MDVNTSNEMIVRMISHNSLLYSSKEFILKKDWQGNRWGFQLLTLGKAVSMKSNRTKIMMLESQLSIAPTKHQVIIHCLPNINEQSGASQVFGWLGTAGIQL